MNSFGLFNHIGKKINRLKVNSEDDGGGTFDVKPGKESCTSADITCHASFTFSLEMFPGSADLNIQPGVLNFETRLKFLDSRSRSLYLLFRVSSKFGGTVRITAYAPYWLLNKTGLPLVFKEKKEENTSTETEEAAGQAEEHESKKNVCRTPVVILGIELYTVHKLFTFVFSC